MSTNIKSIRIVGVDLGTTNSVITYLDDTGKPKIIPNLDGEMITPSVVYVGPGAKEILVGTAARNMMAMDPARTIKEFKRDVGKGVVYFKEGDLEITPEWCQAQILKFLRESAIKYSGDDRAASQMVVTVPAYFGEKERQSVKRSVEMAGAELIQLINEPTAAGLAFGINEKQGDRLVLIMDFGGGTFDATVMQYSGGEATVLASDGDKQLGGKDVDNLLLGLVTQAFRAEHSLEVTPESHPAEHFSIWEEGVRQKHMLASRQEVRICGRAAGKQVVITLTRDEFNALIKDLVDRVEAIGMRAIAAAKVDPADVKHVLLVGGSSRLTAIQERVRQCFGPDSILGGQISPDLAIAEGAVIHAVKVVSSKGKVVVNDALKAIPIPAIKHQDVMPHSLGVTVQDVVSRARYCSAILDRNTPIACQATKPYASVDDAQTQFHIVVVQGEEGQAMEDCLVVGERVLVLPARSHMDPSLEATMSYDSSGMVHVVVNDRVSGKSEDITVDFYSKQPAIK